MGRESVIICMCKHGSTNVLREEPAREGAIERIRREHYAVEQINAVALISFL